MALRFLVVLFTLVGGLAFVAPTPATAVSAPVQVVTSDTNTCALDSAGQTYCWGRGTVGELGNNTWVNSSVPVPVAQGTKTFVTITAGADHFCGLMSSGATWCWGNNWSNQLGNGVGGNRNTPVAVVQPGGVNFVAITAGAAHTCGMTGSGTVWCWGRNSDGQLGDASTTTRTTPVEVQLPGGVTFASMTSGAYHNCGLTSLGLAYCWGLNDSGEIGDTSNTSRTTPVTVSQGATRFTSIVGGEEHTCALSGSGATWCWGINGESQLGNNSTTDRNFPVAVQQPGGVTFSSITVGYAHSCGRTASGDIWCWGRNTDGELGDTTTTRRATPVQVSGGGQWAQVVSSEGSHHTCAISSTSGKVFCWGRNLLGQYGNSTTVSASVPTESWYSVTVTGATTSVAVDPTLSFTISGHSGTCNGVATSGSASATGSSVSFGRINSSTVSAASQDLQVAANAASGFTVFLRSSGPLSTGTGQTIANVSGFNGTPGAFSLAGSEGFGYTTSESALNLGTADRFTTGGPKWAAATTTNDPVAFAAAATTRSVCVAFKVGASANTAAGTYSTTITYTAVPTF